MKDGNSSSDSNLKIEIARIADLAAGMFLQVKEFTREHGNQVLLSQPLRVDAATELACIVSDCRSISEALNSLRTGPSSVLENRCSLQTPQS